MKLIDILSQDTILKNKELIAIKEGKISTLSLVNREDLVILLMSLDTGRILKTHTTNGDAFILCLEGQARFIIDEKESIISEGESVVLSKEIPHSVEALSPYKMLLVIVKDEQK